MNFKSTFLKETSNRGYIHQVTDLEGLDAQLSSKIVTGYNGFDATADSLHVGSLMPIMLLRRLQKAGHRPIVLMGGGTTKIGDPSGKDSARQLLDQEQINNNIASLSRVFKKFITFGNGPTDAILVNNDDWLCGLNYIDFLRDYGKHFSVNRMLSFDSVKLRLDREQPLSFLEFNYMIFQAYDFVELKKKFDCDLQLGGSDQWGNIINGVDLGRKVLNKTLFGFTAPLVTTSNGAKMGKTAQGAVWLNEERLSPYDYWQFWRNTDDADTIRYMKLFTDMPLEEISEYEKLTGADLNKAKIRLADDATQMLHGQECLVSIHRQVDYLFSNNSQNPANLETFLISPNDFIQGEVSLIDLMVNTGLSPSKGESRRLIRGQGVKIDDQIVLDENLKLTAEQFEQKNTPLKLSVGKKKHILIQIGEN